MAGQENTCPLGAAQRLGPMSEPEFAAFSRFIHQACGIKMPQAKKTMLEARLAKRLKALGLADFGAYREFVFSPDGQRQELGKLIDAVTTNTTCFFREPRHFDYLARRLVPALRAQTSRPVMAWSAGCSSGEEPYSLGMVLDYCLGERFSILATDICTTVLRRAAQAIYPVDVAGRIPPEFRPRYLLRSKDPTAGQIRVAPEIRRRISFRQLNFMTDFDLREEMQLIFCRNVVIYFNRQTQQALFGKLCRHLAPGGHLFIGHSESLSGMLLPLKQVAPSIYQKLP